MGDDANHVALLGFEGPFNLTISFQGSSLSLSQGNTSSLQKLRPSRWLMWPLVASLLAASWAHAHAWIGPLQVVATFQVYAWPHLLFLALAPWVLQL